MKYRNFAFIKSFKDRMRVIAALARMHYRRRTSRLTLMERFPS